MARSENYQCDVCGNSKGEREMWWMAWVDCFPLAEGGETQPLMKITRWEVRQAHEGGVKHLCGARCAGTLLDRWMTEQHENPEERCAPGV